MAASHVNPGNIGVVPLYQPETETPQNNSEDDSPRDWQALVNSDIVQRRWIKMDSLDEYNPGDIWWQYRVEFPRLKITEDDGVQVTLRGVRRAGSFVVVRGQVLDEVEADAIEEAEETNYIRQAVWDFNVHAIEQTNGPEARAELLESFEKRKHRLRDEEREKTEGLTEVLQGIRPVLQGKQIETPMLASPENVIETLQENFTVAQMEEMVEQLKEQAEEKPKSKRR